MTVGVQMPTRVPLSERSDVAVFGGGPGGIGAAVAAARGGADVVLYEHYGFLGGMATAGEVNPFMPNHLAGDSLDTGIFEDWLGRIDHYGGQRGNTRVFDPHAARLAAEDLCLEAGVRLRYHHRAVHVETAGRNLTSVVVHSKSGLAAAQASTYIDATGDGDVAALAGCAFDVGDAQGHCQPMTLCFKLQIDPDDIPEDARAGDSFRAVLNAMPEVQALYQQAKADGRIDCPRENVLIFRGVDRNVVHFNTTRVIHRSSTDGRDLSDAEIQGRRQLRQLLAVLREGIPVFRHARIYSIAPQIGIRESRRICGRAYLTLDDYTAGRTFPDAIARVTYPIDIHNPNGSGTVLEHLPKGKWCEIPWPCLLPADIDNLAIASRCISVDHAVHSAIRVMPPVCSIGQAAGTAAALATQNQIPIYQVDSQALRDALIQAGRHLHPLNSSPAKPSKSGSESADPAARTIPETETDPALLKAPRAAPTLSA